MSHTYLEVRHGVTSERIPVSGEKLTLGKDEANDICIANDPSVSHLHMVLERYGASWVVRDLGSSNGTYLNGERILGEKQLRDGDELKIGSTSITFKADSTSPTVTQKAQPAPELTRREKEILIALCRPVLSGSMFTRPASIRQIAEELVVTENAVKQHLGRLYDKFKIFKEEGPRTLQLANEAIGRGAVSLADLKPR